MQTFLSVCAAAYAHPIRAFRALRRAPAPAWGLYGVLVRSLLLSLCYYLFLVFFTPVFFFLEWLMLGGFTHLVLRYAGCRDDMDAILNCMGLCWLVIQPVLLILDWVALAFGVAIPATLGIAHLVIALGWGTVLTVIAYREVLCVPYWLSFLVSVAASLIHLPLGALFMRPV